MLMKRILLLAAAILTATAGATAQNEYSLKQVVVLSRHNIRSPLSGGGSLLGRITPHEWHEWTAPPGHLTRKGGVMETMMGQYFGMVLREEGLLDGPPAPGEVHFYANSMQRTIATARYFLAGFMPTEDIVIHHRFAPGSMDPVFNPRLTSDTPEFREEAMRQIEAFGGKKGLAGVNKELKESFRLLEKVLDMKDAPSAAGDTVSFGRDGTVISLGMLAEPGMKGSLKMATSAADALVLQYYEEPDDLKASFGHPLSREEWEKISRIKDVYGDILFTAPVVAANVAFPLLRYIRDELTAPGRKFSFLCGHDSNIGSVTAALGVREYSLPETIEKKTPIGCKLVFEKWERNDGRLFARVNLVYQSTDDIRAGRMVSNEYPPVSYNLSFDGLEADEDGFIPFDELVARFDNSIADYRKY